MLSNECGYAMGSGCSTAVMRMPHNLESHGFEFRRMYFFPFSKAGPSQSSHSTKDNFFTCQKLPSSAKVVNHSSHPFETEAGDRAWNQCHFWISVVIQN